MNLSTAASKRTIVLLAFALIGFAAYYPILGNSFLSDDYDSLFRICVQKRIIYREFLRPMIDLSFYLNYRLSGFSARSYYLFNVLIHVLNAFLVFQVTIRYPLVSKNARQRVALFSAFLFLLYPFHNESIVWLSGRLSSLACLFALLSLKISLERRGFPGFLASALLYLMGLLCYESILLLPVIILLMTWHQQSSYKKMAGRAFSWIAVVAGYLFLRFYISGGITGDYGERIMDVNPGEKMMNLVKVSGRLFLPPSENSGTMVIIFAGICLTIVLIHWRMMQKKSVLVSEFISYMLLAAALLFSLLIPIAFGVSTRTGEGDRLLYFPSVFFCIIAARWIIAIPDQKWQTAAILLTTIASLWFLEKSNRQWVMASNASRSILREIQHTAPLKINLINLPDELEGAFVFRNGFRKALILNNIDTSRVCAINYLKRLDYLEAPPEIPVVNNAGELFIYPSVTIKDTLNSSWQLTNITLKKSFTLEKERNLIYYWDKQRLVRIF